MKSSRSRDCAWPPCSIARWAKRLRPAQMGHILPSEEAQLLNIKVRFSRLAMVVVGGMGFMFLLHSPAIGQGKSEASHAEKLPTGMSITPEAARGSKLQYLNPDLPGMP